MKPLLMLRHDRVETFGVAGPALADAGFDLAVISVYEPPARLPEIHDVSGIVMFGGEMHVDTVDRFPVLAWECDLTRRAIDLGVPFLGICLGAQMLARSLGIDVVRSPDKEIGFTPVTPTAAAASDPLLHALAPGDLLFQWHEDTFAQPPGTKLLATGERVPIQAVRAGERAWGIQFHFEVDMPELELWIEKAGDLEAGWGTTAEELRHEAETHLPTQGVLARKILDGFAEQVHAAG